MKKFIVSILAILYLSTSMGATVHFHYCMDKLINWSLFNLDGDECGKCGMAKDDDCCKDEHKFVKNDTDQKIAESQFQLLQITHLFKPGKSFCRAIGICSCPELFIFPTQLKS